jgi:tRNA U34 5-carboxymethylaminomethyl modifying enzyme MnmG/GidA
VTIEAKYESYIERQSSVAKTLESEMMNRVLEVDLERMGKSLSREDYEVLEREPKTLAAAVRMGLKPAAVTQIMFMLNKS